MRKISFLLFLGVVGMAALAGPAKADIVIDEFTAIGTNPGVTWPLTHNSGTPVTLTNTETTFGPGGPLGGSRVTVLTKMTATNADPIDANVLTTPGAFDYSSATAADGSVRLTYDGNGSGLGNLTAGGNVSIVLKFLNYDHPGSQALPVTLTASDGTNTVSVVKNLNAAAPPDQLLGWGFNEFGAVNFAAIRSLSFSFDPVTSSDFRLDYIRAVPEPSPALLGLLGISFAFAARKLRSFWS